MGDQTGRAYRSYLITSNNPHLHYDFAAIDYATAAEGDYRRIARSFVERFAHGSNGRDRDPEKSGAAAVFEVGEQGTPHVHMLVCSKNPIKFSALQRKFPHSDIEPVRGSADQALDYIHKRGRHEDKAGTRRCEPYTWGSFFADNQGTPSETPIFADIDALLDQGLRPRDIFGLGTKFGFYRNAVMTAYDARRAADIPLRRDVKTYYHVGESGTGKSHAYWELCERHGSENVYFVNGVYEHIWDFYDYEPVVVLDDFRAASMPLTALLGLMDEYPTVGRARYVDKRLAFTELHITSVIPPERLYYYDSYETYAQLRRRITQVVYHYIDQSREGDERYQSLIVPGDEYTSYSQLNERTSEVMGIDIL